MKRAACVVLFLLGLIPLSTRAETRKIPPDPHAALRLSEALAYSCLLNPEAVPPPPPLPAFALIVPWEDGEGGEDLFTGTVGWSSAEPFGAPLERLRFRPSWTQGQRLAKAVFIRAGGNETLFTLLKTAPVLTLGTAVKLIGLGRAWLPATIVYNANNTFQTVTSTVGEAMQRMNPPRFLQQQTEWGWTGAGTYVRDGVPTNYHQVLVSGGGPIIRGHLEWSVAPGQVYHREAWVSTPAANGLERYMNVHYPLGSGFDPALSTGRVVTSIQRVYSIVQWPPAYVPPLGVRLMSVALPYRVMQVPVVQWSGYRPRTVWVIPRFTWNRK